MPALLPAFPTQTFSFSFKTFPVVFNVAPDNIKTPYGTLLAIFSGQQVSDPSCPFPAHVKLLFCLWVYTQIAKKPNSRNIYT